jgi:hypothetical protein
VLWRTSQLRGELRGLQGKVFVVTARCVTQTESEGITGRIVGVACLAAPPLN